MALYHLAILVRALSSGRMAVAQKKSSNIVSTSQCEILTATEGLMLARNLGLSDVVVEFNSLLVIQGCKNGEIDLSGSDLFLSTDQGLYRLFQFSVFFSG